MNIRNFKSYNFQYKDYFCEEIKTLPMQEKDNNSKLKKWFKRVGWAGLAFFTIKGLVWLVIFYFGADALSSCFQQ